jgi:phage protein D
MADKGYSVSFDGAPADSALYGDVHLLEVEESVIAPSLFTIHIETDLDANGSWSHLDDDNFSLFTKIGIAVGFTSAEALTGGGSQAGLVPVIEGYVTEASVHTGSRPGDSYLEVRGMDACALMSMEEKAVAWPNMADSDIVQQIVSDYGLTVDTTATSTVHQDTDTLILQRSTDAAFVRQLAARNGFLFYFSQESGDSQASAYFGPPKLDGSPQADLAARFGPSSNLQSFDAHVSGLRPLSVKTTQVDPHSKQDSTAQADSAQLQALGASLLDDLVSPKLDQLVTPLDAQGGLLLLAQPTADQTELQAVAQAVREESAWLISASGEINSDAYLNVLRPGRLVLVKGVGAQYSGTYFVTQVTHRMRSDGTYVQLFEARRNARDLDGTEQFGQSLSVLGVAVP